jgi:hypothetical protein
MIEGMHPVGDERAHRQLQFLIARTMLSQQVLANALRAFYEYAPPKTDKERANAKLSLETSLTEAQDPGNVFAFIKDHPELIPISMR